MTQPILAPRLRAAWRRAHFARTYGTAKATIQTLLQGKGFDSAEITAIMALIAA